MPLRVDPISESHRNQRSKQKFMQVNKTLFSKKRQGAGQCIKINTVYHAKLSLTGQRLFTFSKKGKAKFINSSIKPVLDWCQSIK